MCRVCGNLSNLALYTLAPDKERLRRLKGEAKSQEPTANC